MAVQELLGPAPPAGRRFGAWQIELTTRCPLACRMCIRRGPDAWRSRDMRFDEFERLAGHLAEVETVILQGWGEPLLHARLVDIVRLVKDARARAGGDEGSASPAVGFVTSGKGLDARYAEALVGAGLDFIGFSLAGVTPSTHAAIRVHSELDEVTSAVRHVSEARRRGGRRAPRIHCVFLMVKDNIGELPGLPALARRMGADEIVLTNLIQVVDGWQDEQKVFGRREAREYEAILAETARRAEAGGLAVRRASLSPAPTPVCEEDPLRNLYVGVEGEVSPCVYLGPPVPRELTRRFGDRSHRLEKVSFGNALRTPLPAIWGGPAYAAFRARFLRRARRPGLLGLVTAPWPARAVRAGGAPLPDPPDACRTCHKLLGV